MIETLLALLLAIVPAPLRRAHAHNDYEHPRPLLDALDRGFCSVEADIWLGSDGRSLLVAHTPFGLKPERTLQKLYLDPLRERVKRNSGPVQLGSKNFHLLIDVKTDAKPTCMKLLSVLEDYSDVLGSVTVVVSGNCDRGTLTDAKKRLAAIDGRPADFESNAPAGLIPWISTSWASQFKWNGTGTMPEAERMKLKEFVASAHKHGRKVRFWAAPDKPEVWRELLNADVDLINTDKLDELRTFLGTHDSLK